MKRAYNAFVQIFSKESISIFQLTRFLHYQIFYQIVTGFLKMLKKLSVLIATLFCPLFVVLP